MRDGLGAEEISQGIARIGVCVLAFLFHQALIAKGYPVGPHNLAFISGYGAFSSVWLVWVRRDPWRFPWRPYVTAVGDMGMNCLMMFTLGEFSFYFYPLFLWMMVGYGIRFGPIYLTVAWLLGLTMFAVVLLTSDFWSDRRHLGFALLIGLVILPWFFLGLIRKLHRLNRSLEDELGRSASLIAEAGNELRFLQLINTENEFRQVAQIIVDKCLFLFPEAEKARFLMFDSEHNDFRFLACHGYDDGMSRIRINPEELVQVLEEGDSEIVRHTHYLRLDGARRLPGSLRVLPVPQSLIAMRFYHEQNLIGVLVMDNFRTADAFAETDRERLENFRFHAGSAASKVWLLHTLQRRNHELTVRQNQLVVQEKMASLGTLTAGLAHQVQNPLNFINNFAQIAIERLTELGEELKERDTLSEITEGTLEDITVCLQRVTSHGQGLAKIIRTMQMLAVEEKHVIPVPFNDTLSECITLILGDDIDQYAFSVTTALDPRIGTIRTYGQSLNRALVNLLQNAREATVARIGRDPSFSGRVTIRTRATGDEVWVTVADNGGGIEPDIEPLVFEPFFTTKSSSKGHIGLGLSLCREIVCHRLSGALILENNPGDGATFVMRLPSMAR